MPTWPLIQAERHQLRVDATARYLSGAEASALRYGRSLKCAPFDDPQYVQPKHADQPGGCANDGTGCLCPCHDPQTEGTAA